MSADRNREDTADDSELADAMVASIVTVKAWAKKAAEKINDSISINPMVGKATKDAMIPLIGENGYKDRAKLVRDRMRKLEKLEGPVGKDGDAGDRYDQSDAWQGLAARDDHWWKFIFVCRPDLTYIPDHRSGVGEIPYDVIRQHPLSRNAMLEQMLNEGNAGFVWRSDKKGRIQALTVRTDPSPPTGQIVHIPETITFHLSWIEHQRTRGFAGWSQEAFDEVTAPDAMGVFEDKGDTVGGDIGPADSLLDSSFNRNMFHEMFHLSAFGAMFDSEKPYCWANNARENRLENPDLYAIIAIVIELLNREGGSAVQGVAGGRGVSSMSLPGTWEKPAGMWQ